MAFQAGRDSQPCMHIDSGGPLEEFSYQTHLAPRDSDLFGIEANIDYLQLSRG